MANGARHPVTPNLIQPHNASSNGTCSHTRHHPATVGRMPGLCEPGDAQDDGEQIRRNPQAREPSPPWALIFVHDLGYGHPSSRPAQAGP